MRPMRWNLVITIITMNEVLGHIIRLYYVAYHLLLPLIIMKNVVPMSEIHSLSLSDLIHCYGSMSSLLIADRHSDGTVPEISTSFIYSTVIQYLH